MWWQSLSTYGAVEGRLGSSSLERNSNALHFVSFTSSGIEYIEWITAKKNHLNKKSTGIPQMLIPA